MSDGGSGYGDDVDSGDDLLGQGRGFDYYLLFWKVMQGSKGEDIFPLPVNSYGDLIVSLVATVDANNMGGAKKLEHLWLGAASCMYLLTVSSQFLLSFALWATTQAHAGRKYTHGGAAKMASKMQAAVLDGMPLPQLDPARLTCATSDVSVVPAYFMILIIWILAMTEELSRVTWLVIVTQRVSVEAQVHNDSDEGSGQEGSPGGSGCSQGGGRLIREYTQNGTRWYQIQFLTPRLRRVSLCIALLQLMVTIWILFAGTTFLVYAHETRVVVLKCLTCTFFVHIGDLLFKWLVSEAKLRRLKHTVFCFHALKSEDWTNYGSTCFRIVFVVVTASLIWFWMFHSLREFRYACLEYKAAFPDRHDANYGVEWWFF